MNKITIFLIMIISFSIVWSRPALSEMQTINDSELKEVDGQFSGLLSAMGSLGQVSNLKKGADFFIAASKGSAVIETVKVTRIVGNVVYWQGGVTSKTFIETTDSGNGLQEKMSSLMFPTQEFFTTNPSALMNSANLASAASNNIMVSVK